jgi:hypothetical protein
MTTPRNKLGTAIGAVQHLGARPSMGKMLTTTGTLVNDGAYDALPGKQARLRKLHLNGSLLPKGLGP